MTGRSPKHSQVAPWSLAGLLLAVALLASCATAPPLPEWPDSHPASSRADAAPERAPSSTLTMPKPAPAAAAGAGGHRR